MFAEYGLLDFIKTVYPVITGGIITISVGVVIGLINKRYRIKILEMRLALLDRQIEDCHL